MEKIILTADGSHSIFNPSINATFHSHHGAIAESQHIFINAGLKPLLTLKKDLCILEIGFGTGLNTLLTRIAAEYSSHHIYYETFDTDPLSNDIVQQLNYCEQCGRAELKKHFVALHLLPWDTEQLWFAGFAVKKRREDFACGILDKTFDLVYFDAFDPVTQPQLWTPDIFLKIFRALRPGGRLVTYSSKSSVRRALQQAGFHVNKLPGPKGKREIVVAEANNANVCLIE